MRACPFCGETSSARFGERFGAVYLRCSRCRSVFMDLALERFSAIHEQAFTDDEFADRFDLSTSATPDHSTWSRIAKTLKMPRTVLEIGPGTGHLLAAARAAGCEIHGVESSARHRDLIMRQWRIPTLGDLSELGSTRVDAIVAVNVLEHVYDVCGFMRALGTYLRPKGNIFISTVNARAFSARLLGVRWAMFKPADHVSFPSAEGMRSVAKAAGVTVGDLWTGELPLETPVSVAVALRDMVAERKSLRMNRSLGRDGPPSALPNINAAPDRRGDGRNGRPSVARRLVRAAWRLRPIDPTAPLIGALGGGATVKAIFTAG